MTRPTTCPTHGGARPGAAAIPRPVQAQPDRDDL